MIKVYPSIIHQDGDGMWLEFPDLPGCQTYGNTLEEILKNAEEALGAYLAVKMEYNECIPEASDIQKVSCDPKDIKTYVTVDVNKYHKDTRAVKKMLSIPAWLAKEADAHNFSLSKILQEALLEKLNMV